MAPLPLPLESPSAEIPGLLYHSQLKPTSSLVECFAVWWGTPVHMHVNPEEGTGCPDLELQRVV